MAPATHIAAPDGTAPLLTTHEAAARLHVHPATIRRYVAHGTLTATKIGPGRYARLRFAPADVDALLRPREASS